MGTPVLCRGLNKMAYLNGKIGDIRKIDIDEDGRCEVHFEDDTTLKRRVQSIKPENLQILFDLTPKG